MYQVSCEELDWLVAYTLQSDQIEGARMMGGGFGGCTINLVREDAVDDFVSTASEAYFKKMQWQLTSYKVETADGTAMI
jgi:galactokinase